MTFGIDGYCFWLCLNVWMRGHPIAWRQGISPSRYASHRYYDFNRPTHFTQNEQYTLMSLWSIARSPLIFGGDMTKLDDFTKQMLTNPEVLKVNQESTNNRQVSNDGNLIVWAADIPGSEDKYVALFNAQSKGDDIDKKLNC